MKKLLTLLIISFLAFDLFAQCGNDSIVSSRERLMVDGDLTLTIHVDSFDLTSGLVYQYEAQGINLLPGVPVFLQTVPFTRSLISYNSNHDTIQYTALLGNGSGYDNQDKIDFTWNGSNQPLTRITYSGSGSSWTLSKNETWSYSSGRISSYIVSGSSGNLFQKNYSYNGAQGTSVTTQVWNSGAWLNSERFLFSYNGNVRDSIFLQRWDINGGVWIDSLSAFYDSTDFYFAGFFRHDSPLNEDYSYYYDTLNNLRRNITTTNATLATQTYQYGIFNNHVLETREAYNDQSYSSDENFYYDQYGFLTGSQGGTQSSTGGSDYSENFDSFHRIIFEESSSSSGAGDGNRQKYYGYSSSNLISVDFFQVDQYPGMLCQGDSLQTIPIIRGGCGPLHYQWSPSTGLSSDTIPNPIVLLDDSTFYVITVTDTTGHSTSDTLIVYPEFHKTVMFDTTLCPGCPVVLSVQYDPNEQYQWYRNDTLISGAQFESYTAISSGDYHVVVQGSQCNYISNTINLTLSGLTRITGNIFLDVDSNCMFNAGDRILFRYGPSPYFIKISRQNYTGYIAPDSNGVFDFPIDTGSFNLSISNPSQIYAPSCPDSGIIMVNVPNYGDTISGVSLMLKPLYNCERVRVWVSADHFRICSTVGIYVHYANEGVVTSNNSFVDVTLPPELLNISSVFPFTILSNGNYHFSLPALPVGEIGEFIIHADVSCNPADILGATLCIDAEISPVDFCSLQPDSTWDGSNVRVFSNCQGNTDVCFRILNDSTGGQGGDMDSASVWKLFADNILIQQGTFQLTAGDDTVLCFVSDGRTFRLEADQLSGFPDNNYPSASIERCGTLAPGHNYSLGKILYHAPQNVLPFYSTYCGVVRYSFDPNAKSVQPSGTFAPLDRRMIYRIDFQNTGSDTAFKVVVKDDLWDQFDYTSLQLTGSSHPFNFSIEGRALVWTFDPIALPDSTVNEQKSHGYVEFSVLPGPKIRVGNIILNGADIYFDQNAPVTAPQVGNLICSEQIPQLTIGVINGYCQHQTLTLKATLQLNNPSFVQYRWYKNGVLETHFTDDFYIENGLVNGDTIKVKLTNIFYCYDPDTISATFVIQFPAPGITYNAPNLESSAALSYQWLFNNVIIPGATAQTYTPVQSGNYQVRTFDSSACTATSSVYYFYNTGIVEIGKRVSLYPNPADHTVTVEGVFPGEEISIMDISGQIIFFIVADSPSQKIQVSDLVPGMYFVRMKYSNVNRALIIQHE